MNLFNNYKYKYENFLNKYLLPIFFGLGLLLLLPYTTLFNFLAVKNISGLIYRAVILFVIYLFFGLSLLFSKKIPNKWVILALSIYLICSILSLIITPTIHPNVDIPKKEFAIGITEILSTIIAVFIAIYFLKNFHPTNKSIKFTFIVTICFVVFLCLYTYIFELKSIVNTFTNENGWNYDVKSIFDAKTEYGFALLIGSVVAVLYAEKFQKFSLYFIPCFFLLNSLISRTKTALLCISLLLFLMLIEHFIKNKNNKILKFLLLMVIIFFIISILIITIPVFQKGIFKNIKEIIIDDGIVVLKDRAIKFNNIFANINNPFNVIFGCGERITNFAISPAKLSGDSLYVSIYATGGIIKSILYIFGIIFTIRYCLKTDDKFNKIFIRIVIISIFLISGFFEDDTIIGIKYTSLILMPLVFATNNIL